MKFLKLTKEKVYIALLLLPNILLIAVLIPLHNIWMQLILSICVSYIAISLIASPIIRFVMFLPFFKLTLARVIITLLITWGFYIVLNFMLSFYGTSSQCINIPTIPDSNTNISTIPIQPQDPWCNNDNTTFNPLYYSFIHILPTTINIVFLLPIIQYIIACGLVYPFTKLNRKKRTKKNSD